MAEESPFQKIDRESGKHKGKEAKKKEHKGSGMTEMVKKFHTSAKEKGGY